MKNMKRKPGPFNGMTFSLDGDHHDIGIKNEVLGIKLFAIELANYITRHIELADDSFDITQKTADVLKLNGKPVFKDTSVDAAHDEATSGSFASFYKLIEKWDYMEISGLAFVEALFKECIALIENRYDIEVHVKACEYEFFSRR
ncbi:hypothetical protein MTBPR1_200026 [Candidatus Terasakiella magnetica]|uniref:Uncharacterized protein n=1 Tax=Candidatus Terasakiella magnetica TaxID=1867952 RepID=A0A1C3RGW3_9PROT|nr:hypothetical protein [Candidatus Terasakiella magnetica]SCA56546.1 hypothetical protein MTBPR1_200026 [Candidatus Terasakiella magnetica]